MSDSRIPDRFKKETKNNLAELFDKTNMKVEQDPFMIEQNKSKMKDKDGIDLTEATPMLFKKVVDWADDKGIVLGVGADSTKQLAKTMEELGEVASALLRDNQEGVEDGIGDVMVCLIVLAAQNGTDAFKCLQGAYDEIKGRTGKTIDGVFVKSEDL